MSRLFHLQYVPHPESLNSPKPILVVKDLLRAVDAIHQAHLYGYQGEGSTIVMRCLQSGMIYPLDDDRDPVVLWARWHNETWELEWEKTGSHNFVREYCDKIRRREMPPPPPVPPGFKPLHK